MKDQDVTKRPIYCDDCGQLIDNCECDDSYKLIINPNRILFIIPPINDPIRGIMKGCEMKYYEIP